MASTGKILGSIIERRQNRLMTSRKRLTLIRKIALKRRGIREDTLRDLEELIRGDVSAPRASYDGDDELAYDTLYTQNKENEE